MMAMAGIYGTSMPTSSSLGSLSERGSPKFPLISVKWGSYNLNSPRSYQTARSSLASYKTAQSGSVSMWQSNAVRTGMAHNVTQKTEQADLLKDSPWAFQQLVRGVVAQALVFANRTGTLNLNRQETTGLENHVGDMLMPIKYIAASNYSDLVRVVISKLKDYEVQGRRDFFSVPSEDVLALERVISLNVCDYAMSQRILSPMIVLLMSSAANGSSF
ncbi:hypothetical protein BKA63DRAFT_100379 [Paraphoma chrysanthemicola]|nr:hypothetical protein BKA63DRAFT_100379 [Paraphoma chrysanthemicola]